MEKNWFVEKNPKLWMTRANSNLELARAEPDSDKICYEDRCYLCSRGVECSIKALMALKLGKYKRGHNLDDLITELEKNGISIPFDIKDAALREYSYDKTIMFPFKLPISFSAKTSLTKNTLKTRYPDDYPPIAKNGFVKALNKAELIVSWVNQQFENMNE
jgi:HEPN domain-containing protein